MSYKTVDVSIDESTGVGVVLLNAPDTQNALGGELMSDLAAALDELEQSDAVRCIVLGSTSHKYFSIGLAFDDLAAMEPSTAYRDGFITDDWDRLARCRKPTIAAVSGIVRGAGMELALAADMLIAGKGTRFVLGGVAYGLMPGMGGTQRLTRAIGKAKTMQMCLTGQPMSASDADALGLVTELASDDAVVESARDLARQIAAKPLHVTMMIKDSINAAHETSLSQGLSQERHLFRSLFRTDDFKEGLEARLDDRQPHFKHH